MKLVFHSAVSMDRWRRGAAVVLACTLFNGCTTTQRVPFNDAVPIASVVRAGDDIVCTLHDGSRTAFKVTAVDASMLRGNAQSVRVDDIAQIELKRLSPGKTAVLTGFVALTAAAVIAQGRSSLDFPGMGP
jgi:hypothetical protein